MLLLRCFAAMTLSFRPAEAEDLDALVAIHASAYPDGRSYDERVRNFVGNARGTLDDLWIARRGGAVVGHAFLFRMSGWFGGARVPVGGIASVGVAPEARGDGVASRLLAHLHDVARARGDALTILYPFRQGFYGRMGYAATSPYRHLRFAPSALRFEAELPVRAARGEDRDAMVQSWEQVARSRTGMLVRSKAFWDRAWSDVRSTWLVAEGPDGVEGHVAWSVSQAEPYAETNLVVLELTARSERAARSLWAAVAAQRDQVGIVHADVPDDDPIDRALVDPDRATPGNRHVPHPVGELALGPMVRVADLERALGARGYRGAGRLVLDVGERIVELCVRDGVATVTPSAGEPTIRVDPVALAAVAFGGVRPSQAASLGWLRARDDRALALADAVLAVPPYFSPDRF